jgi:hypothetical protein
VPRRALTRLVLLLAALGCVLVALRVLPAVSAPSEVRPAVIVNDTANAVVAVHCGARCPTGNGVTIEPGRELRAGPPPTRWQLRTPAGEALGCVSGTSPGQRLPVTQATPCA